LKFLTKPNFSELYEFRCNIDEQGQIDSPITLQWNPVFSYLDNEKNNWGFGCTAVYDPKLRRVDVLNLNQLTDFQSKSFESSNIFEVKH